MSYDKIKAEHKSKLLSIYTLSERKYPILSGEVNTSCSEENKLFNVYLLLFSSSPKPLLKFDPHQPYCM